MSPATEQCVFCGDRSSLAIVAQSDLSLAFLDINPINRGHILVVPLRHTTEFVDMTAAEAADLMQLAHKVERALRQALGDEVEGTNLHMANGPTAGQSVFHAHLHVIPRQRGDGVELVENPDRRVPALSQETAAQLRGLLR